MDRGGFACLCRSRCRIEFESWVDPGFVMPRYCAFRGCRKQVRKKFCAAHRPKEDGDGDGNEEQSCTVVGDTLAAKGPPKPRSRKTRRSRWTLLRAWVLAVLVPDRLVVRLVAVGDLDGVDQVARGEAF